MGFTVTGRTGKLVWVAQAITHVVGFLSLMPIAIISNKRVFYFMDTKKLCPHCKQEVDPKASRCPHCHGKIYRWTFGRMMMVGLLGLVVFFIVVSTTTNINSSEPNPTAAQDAAELAAWQQTPAGQLCAKHPDWKRLACDAIVAKKVRVGMTKEQAIAAWGEPEDINTTSTAGGTHEQWVYGFGNYIYFDNGILSTVQN